MTDRKKRGIGFFLSGLTFVVGGIVSFAMSEDPTWFATGVSLVGLIATFFGFKVVFPDQE